MSLGICLKKNPVGKGCPPGVQDASQGGAAMTPRGLADEECRCREGWEPADVEGEDGRGTTSSLLSSRSARTRDHFAREVRKQLDFSLSFLFPSQNWV